MLQGELDVSSAETFAWAMTETKRAISVGRPTGGWGIIPKAFDLPSGLAKIRIVVNDRPTPVKGVHTEGVGWPPDVLVPFSPGLAALGDPDSHVAREILRLLHAGVPLEETRAAFRDLFAGNVAAFRTFAAKTGPKAKGFEGEKLARLVLDDLAAEIAMELEASRLREVAPDAVGAAKRLPALVARAKAARLTSQAAELEKAVRALASEAAAQEALLALADPRFAAAPAQRAAWLAKHGTTRTGRFVRERLWK
jgi:hypothetical protein